MLVVENGDCPAQVFWESLDVKVQARFQHRFQKVADNVNWRHPEHFKKIERTDLYEFKKHQARFFCFWSRQRRGLLVITHGVIKKKNKLDPSDLERANRFRALYERKGE